MIIKAFFDKATFTLTYVVHDEATRDAVVIDPVLDFDPASGRVTRSSADDVIAYVGGLGLRVHYVLETHAHADHLSSSQILKEAFPGAQLAIGEGITEVQRMFRPVYDLPQSFPVDGTQFDRLLGDGDVAHAGSLSFKTIFTPGHTPACATFAFGPNLFTGDALFMPDYGTGRCDFPGGSAARLYDSIQRLYDFPDETRVFTGHDYAPNGRPLRYESTIGEEKRDNIQLNAATTRDEFVAFRSTRDATLAAPRLLHPSVQVNIAGGHLPDRFVKIPLTVVTKRSSP